MSSPVPAASERQRRYMAMCAHGSKAKIGCPKGMTKAQMREYSYKSHMPPGATQSPKGDLAKKNDHEYQVQRHFKQSGTILDSAAAFGSGIGEVGHMGEKDSK